jgi:hypothetical protein
MLTQLSKTPGGPNTWTLAAIPEPAPGAGGILFAMGALQA